jgi:hypothetical protein
MGGWLAGSPGGDDTMTMMNRESYDVFVAERRGVFVLLLFFGFFFFLSFFLSFFGAEARGYGYLRGCVFLGVGHEVCSCTQCAEFNEREEAR